MRDFAESRKMCSLEKNLGNQLFCRDGLTVEFSKRLNTAEGVTFSVSAESAS